MKKFIIAIIRILGWLNIVSGVCGMLLVIANDDFEELPYVLFFLAVGFALLKLSSHLKKGPRHVEVKDEIEK